MQKINNKNSDNTHNEGLYLACNRTGSGKTITAFKLSELLKQDIPNAVIFFLVDRKDLDIQTVKEFQKYENYETKEIDHTSNVDDLKKQMKITSFPLIITTIQKMSIVCKTQDDVFFINTKIKKLFS
ncbi:MAG: DEAD/DEAH box helicase family protein [Candidatus Phytoplasma sp. TWB_XP]